MWFEMMFSGTQTNTPSLSLVNPFTTLQHLALLTLGSLQPCLVVSLTCWFVCVCLNLLTAAITPIQLRLVPFLCGTLCTAGNWGILSTVSESLTLDVNVSKENKFLDCNSASSMKQLSLVAFCAYFQFYFVLTFHSALHIAWPCA